MLPFGSLWLPVVLSTVGIFVASSIIHMALKYHAGDMKKLPGGEGIEDAIRQSGAGAGTYRMPWAGSMEECKSPEFSEKMKRGPVGVLTLMAPGPMSMGKPLGQWFALVFVVNFVIAYLARHSIDAGAACGDVFRFVSTATFLAYATGAVTESIWKGQEWSTTLKFWLDAAIYSAVAGGVFCWLWPAA